MRRLGPQKHVVLRSVVALKDDGQVKRAWVSTHVLFKRNEKYICQLAL